MDFIKSKLYFNQYLSVLISVIFFLIGSIAVSTETQTLEEYYQKAEIAVKTGNIPEALSVLSTLVDTFPGEAKGWYNLGNAYKDLKNINEAGRCYKKALELDPGSKGARFNWAKVRTFRGCKYYDIPGALKDYEFLWAEDTNNYALVYEITDLYYRRNNMNLMKKYVIEMQRLAPDKADTYFYRGLIDDNAGEFVKALAVYQEGYAKNTGSNILKDALWESFMRLGNLEFQSGNQTNAYGYFKNAYQLSPARVGSYFKLGETAWLAGDTVLAIEAYSRYTEVRHSSWLGYSNLADILSHDTNRLDEAILIAQKALQWNPNAWEPYDSLGWSYQQQGDLKEAEKHYQKMFKILGFDWDLVMKKGNAVQAVDSLRKLSTDSLNHMLNYLKYRKDKRLPKICELLSQN